MLNLVYFMIGYVYRLTLVSKNKSIYLHNYLTTIMDLLRSFRSWDGTQGIDGDFQGFHSLYSNLLSRYVLEETIIPDRKLIFESLDPT